MKERTLHLSSQRHAAMTRPLATINYNIADYLDEWFRSRRDRRPEIRTRSLSTDAEILPIHFRCSVIYDIFRINQRCSNNE